MSSNPLRLRFLFEKFVRNNCTADELEEFWALISEYSDNDVLEADLKAWWDRLPRNPDPSDLVDSDRILSRVLREGKTRNFRYQHRAAKESLRVKRTLLAAASVLLLGGAILLLKYIYNPSPITRSSYVHSSDIPAPRTNCAIITLANGKKVYLDSVQNGLLAQQGQTQVKKLKDGEIAYRQNMDGEGEEKQGYNTLANPRGSTVVSMTMSDGTKVWLNAGSSITYPVSFKGIKERHIYLKGEAYFEVIHDKAIPFMVSAGAMLLEDVGTKFNVNAYDDESSVVTTLAEGIIKLSKEGRGKKDPQWRWLRPGQQAAIPNHDDKKGPIEVRNNVDVAGVMAWKNGKFLFSSVNIQAIMRQVARWYDVSIVYQGNVTGTISGGISRDANISQLLHILELTGKMKCIIKGKEIIIQPTNTN